MSKVQIPDFDKGMWLFEVQGIVNKFFISQK